MVCPFYNLRGPRSKLLDFDKCMPLKFGFIVANSADPDVMQPYAGVLPVALFICLRYHFNRLYSDYKKGIIRRFAYCKGGTS